MADRISGLDDPPSSRIVRPEERHLLTLAESARGDAEEADPEATDLRPRELECRPEDRLRQVRRLPQCSLPGNRPEARVADLDRDRGRLDSTVAKPARDALAHPEQGSLDDLAIGGIDIEG